MKRRIASTQSVCNRCSPETHRSILERLGSEAVQLEEASASLVEAEAEYAQITRWAAALAEAEAVLIKAGVLVQESELHTNPAEGGD